MAVEPAASSKLKEHGAKVTAKNGLGKKTSTSTKAQKQAAMTATKRHLLQEPEVAPARKRNKTLALKASSTSARSSKRIINISPSQKLDIYVFGSNGCGELGLAKGVDEIKYPRLNGLLDANSVGVVQVAVGGMHCVALTYDQKILTWGVNDNGALGRETIWEAPTRDIDAESDEDEDEAENDLNPKESTPIAIPIESFGKNVTGFAQVAATDSASFALTVDGFVYGWGTFLGNDGKIGLTEENALKHKREDRFEPRPTIVPQLKNIKRLAAGGNHMLALDHKGNVFAWGSGQQRQLGRRLVARTERKGLTPCGFGLPKNRIVGIASGAYNGFAIDDKGQVYGWGLNNFGQTGIPSEDTENESIVEHPTIVSSLEPYKIKAIDSGTHHSLACTTDGKLLGWGRCDDAQLGVKVTEIAQEDLIFDSRNRPRILSKPVEVPGIITTAVAAGVDNSFAVTTDGDVYSWGFSANYRTGLGTDDSVEVATVIKNKALTGKKLTFAACGGQFSVLAGPATLSNGA
ncbi:MAG: hypothetical protein M1825_002544 [Sarcosagium campestre]|nr:MAG: hypothetical protein M1825_002544 [Sarcosagium campestre]